MFDENCPDPLSLLDEYKKYEYVMNVDKKELIDSLFKGGENRDEKQPLAAIEERIQHFDTAYTEIMTLSEDEVNYKMFRIMTKKLKEDLADQADKCKERIMEATYNYCKETVMSCNKQYQELIANCLKDPPTEEEFVEVKSWHARAASEMERLTEILKEVYKHYLMLDKFSYMYTDRDIETFWWMKTNPLRVQVALQDGKATIGERNEGFLITLQKEQEKFVKDIETYKEEVAKVKTLSTLTQAQNLSATTEQLMTDL